MSPATTIQYCDRKEINIDKWNGCVKASANGLIYSYSFYLDAICNNWDAIIIDNYKAMMPLPWRKKAGIKYVYAPPFIQQLGVIGDHEIIDYPQLLEVLKKEFKYGDIFFNYSQAQLPFAVLKKTNFILALNKPYENLKLQFSNDLKKNLKAAKGEELLIATNYDHRKVVTLFQESYSTRMPHVANSDYVKISLLCDHLKEKNMLLTRTVQNIKNEVLATALLLIDNKRIYNLMNTTTEKGRKEKANHYLLNEIIKEFSGTDLLFDFEGSDLPGVKEFYQNFGPANQPYFHYHFNNLPFPLNLIKK